MQGKNWFNSFSILLMLGFLSRGSACGGDLTHTKPNGTISYKLFTPIDKNERCVWIIRVEKANAFVINVDMDFSGENEQEVTLSCFPLYHIAEHLTVDASDTIYLYKCNVLAVTFHSTDRVVNQRGFILEYYAYDGGAYNEISTDSKDIHVDTTTLYTHYPENRTNSYTNYELAIFVIPPTSFNDTLNIVFIPDGIHRLDDYLDVYIFNVTTPGPKWEIVDRASTDVAALVPMSDLAMLVFQSDGSGVGSGFGLTYMSHTNCY